MLIVDTPDTDRFPELRYVVDVVLSDWLGLEFDIFDSSASDAIEIRSTTDRDRSRLTVSADFFLLESTSWLKLDSLPDEPLESVDTALMRIGADTIAQRAGLTNRRVPVLYGRPSIEVRPGHVHCGVDLLGGIFFMLSRYEEIVMNQTDRFGRFRATYSIAHRNEFVERPIVNEYVEIFWVLLAGLWPSLKRRSREFEVWPTHDVDVPFDDLFRSPGQAVRRFLAEALKYRNPRRAFRSFRRWRSVRNGATELDPVNTFGFILQENEKAGLRAAFFFLANGSSDQPIQYDSSNHHVVELIREIATRGHEIALHGSFDSFEDGEKLQMEKQYLNQVLEQNAIGQTVHGNRQHYLRWTTPLTARNLDAVGLQYDSSLGFADSPGFRCGTCWPYPLFDLAERRRLDVLERPLIVMEGSVIAPGYMGIENPVEAYDRMVNLRETCRQYNGVFTILWHNTELVLDEHRELYRSLIAGR